MRLWSFHPKYLDSAGLVALWREALLARAVLRGNTIGYRHHPQLQRFRECRSPRSAINAYLAAVHEEALSRGYNFDRSKLARVPITQQIVTTREQLKYEWSWLLYKLHRRDPAAYRRHRNVSSPAAHPLFSVTRGPICEWERIHDPSAA
jgi:hypothetical protein